MKYLKSRTDYAEFAEKILRSATERIIRIVVSMSIMTTNPELCDHSFATVAIALLG